MEMAEPAASLDQGGLPVNPDFEQIKRTVDIVRVVESCGVELKKVGADHIGLCPFHEDKKPSLHVTQSKGLFHCPACGAAGNVIQFVARKENLTDLEAAQKLLEAIPGIVRASELAPVTLAENLKLNTENSVLLGGVVEHYHETLFGTDKRGLEYLKSRGLADVEMLKHFKVGFVNGSLKRKLSPTQTKTLGILFNEAGNERFYLRVVVPIIDGNGQQVGLYGPDPRVIF